MRVHEIITEADWSKEKIDWSKVRPEYHAGVDEPINRAEILVQKQAFDRSTGHIKQSNVPSGQDIEGQKLVKWQWDVRKELQPKFKEKMTTSGIKGAGSGSGGDLEAWMRVNDPRLGADLDMPIRQMKADQEQRMLKK